MADYSNTAPLENTTRGDNYMESFLADINFSTLDFECNSMDFSTENLQSANSNEWEKYKPVGYRFTPTDEELLGYYLRGKIFGGANLFGTIKDIDLYNHHPSQLSKFAYCSDVGKMHFFTSLRRKHGSNRVDRKTPNGYWKVSQQKTDIFNYNGDLIGSKTPLVYYNKDKQKTQWLMTEYRLEGNENDTKVEETALCVVYQYKPDREKKRPYTVGSSSVSYSVSATTPSEQQLNPKSFAHESCPNDHIPLTNSHRSDNVIAQNLITPHHYDYPRHDQFFNLQNLTFSGNVDFVENYSCFSWKPAMSNCNGSHPYQSNFDQPINGVVSAAASSSSSANFAPQPQCSDDPNNSLIPSANNNNSDYFGSQYVVSSGEPSAKRHRI